ncbi:hypothetical protein JQ556_29245 [Bradyrhizobium ottawaense]|nr:hypothetical protein [Bradyrhizobium ottawaense]
MSQADANYLVGMIELGKGTRARPSELENAAITPPTLSSPAVQTATTKPDREVTPAAAAAAQRQGFRLNEFIVYPAHGVGQILAIEEQEIAGAKLEVFVINFIKDKMTLRVPTARVANVGMRKLVDPATVNRAQLVLASKPHIAEGNWSRIAQEYEAKINSGDFIAIAEVVRDLYRPAVNAGQSYSERQLYEAALDRLSREVSIVQHITEGEALNDIEAILIARPRQWSNEPVRTTEPNGPVGTKPKPHSATFRVDSMDAQALPPSHGSFWLGGDDLWFSFPSKDVSFDGRPYHIPGGAICFPRNKIGREALLKTLRSESDLWAAGDQAALKARLIKRAEQSRS